MVRSHDCLHVKTITFYGFVNCLFWKVLDFKKYDGRVKKTLAATQQNQQNCNVILLPCFTLYCSADRSLFCQMFLTFSLANICNKNTLLLQPLQSYDDGDWTLSHSHRILCILRKLAASVDFYSHLDVSDDI